MHDVPISSRREKERKKERRRGIHAKCVEWSSTAASIDSLRALGKKHKKPELSVIFMSHKPSENLKWGKIVGENVADGIDFSSSFCIDPNCCHFVTRA
jgi:hypothetical protein